jgi:hypothetical protein
MESGGTVYFSGTIVDGDTICADASPEKFGGDVKIYVEGNKNASIHTSCSQPLEPGMIKGNFEITYVELVYEGQKEVSVPAANINGNLGAVTTIISGAAEDLILQIVIPDKGVKNYDPKEDQTYYGTVTVQGLAVNANTAELDEFELELRIVRGLAGNQASGFWGEPGISGNTLYWRDFGLNETGYTLYRALGDDKDYVSLAYFLGEENSYVDEEVRSGVTYRYKMGLRIGGSDVMIGPISITAYDKVPGRFYLSRSFPNPTTGATTLRYTIASKADVSIKVYNVAGQVVETLLDTEKTPVGLYDINWDSSTTSNGIYFCRMTAVPEAGKTFSASSKIVVLR